jgi:hypothetical protein
VALALDDPVALADVAAVFRRALDRRTPSASAPAVTAAATDAEPQVARRTA